MKNQTSDMIFNSRISWLIFFFVVKAINLDAQNLTPKIIQSDNFVKRVANTNPRNLIDVGQQIPVMPQAPGAKINEVYLDEAWKLSSIKIYDSENILEGYKVRYDLRSNVIEFNLKDQTKILDARKVKTLIWLDSLSNISHYFVNGKDFTFNDVPLTSLIELISEGQVSLYKEYSFWVKKADYMAALDVGSHDEKLYKRNKLYYGVGTTLKEVPKKKKEFIKIFGEKESMIDTFMKTNGLSVSKEMEVIQVFDYYNSLK
ncbi:MAG: hypothetical protein K2U26_11840 [Cyclobacteriaceae bacterium]|nr:hypothetical protein [Cyclobacteriaceae bacterium]